MDVIRYWRDPEYRHRVSAEESAGVPDHPAGAVELTDQALAQVIGAGTEAVGTAGCCQGFSSDNQCGTDAGPCAPTQPAYTCSGATCH